MIEIGINRLSNGFRHAHFAGGDSYIARASLIRLGELSGKQVDPHFLFDNVYLETFDIGSGDRSVRAFVEV